MPIYRAVPRLVDLTPSVRAVDPGTGIWPSDPSNDWDYILWGAAGPVQTLRVAGTYYLYYIGGDGFDEVEGTTVNRKIGLATSPDGVTWTKHASNPLFDHRPNDDGEEGVVAAAALHIDGTWHMWYGANRLTSPGQVDMDIRYRTSTDGVAWTDDALVFQTSGHEYQPIAAHFAAGVYSVYYLHIDGSGGGAGGRGPLRRRWGTTVELLDGDELVTSTFFAAGSYAISEDGRLAFVLRNNVGGGKFFEVRQIDPAVLGTISAPIREWEIPEFNFIQPYYEDGLWRMLALSAVDTGSADDFGIDFVTAEFYEVELTSTAYSHPESEPSGGRRWRVYTDEATPVLIYDSEWIADSTTHIAMLTPGDYLGTVQDRSDSLVESDESATFAFVVAAAVVLAPADTTHAHAAESPALAQGHVLSVDSATHGHTAETPTLQVGLTLAPAGAVHAHAAESPQLSQANVLAVEGAIHAHAATEPDLVQGHVLIPAGALHDHMAGSPELVQSALLAVHNALHGHAAVSPSLLQAHVLAPAGAVHAHLADSPSLELAGVLVVDGAMHSHLAESPMLTQAHQLLVDGAVHQHDADSPSLTFATVIAVANAIHAHAAESPALSAAMTLAVQGSIHAHLAESLALTQAHQLIVHGALHGHTAESPTITLALLLAAHDTLHAHAADSPELVSVTLLAVQDAIHAHLAGEPVLIQAGVLAVDGAWHGHTAELVRFFEDLVAHPDYQFIVARRDLDFVATGRDLDFISRRR